MKQMTFAMRAVWYMLLSVPVLLSGAAAASAELPAEIHFLDAKAGCRLVILGTLAFTDGTVQVRRRAVMDRSKNIEGFPGSAGWILTVVDSDVDAATSGGKAWGTFVKVFDTIPATIYGTYSGDVIDGLFWGTLTGRGTGSLEGYRFDAVSQPMPIDELPGGDPCPPPGAPKNVGMILDSTLTLDAPVASNPGANQ